VYSNVSEGSTASIFRLLKRPKYEYTDHLGNQMLRKIYDCKEQTLRKGREYNVINSVLIHTPQKILLE
jgi:hypothetical protein